MDSLFRFFFPQNVFKTRQQVQLCLLLDIEWPGWLRNFSESLLNQTRAILNLLFPPFSLGTLYTRVQIQGVCVWELLRDVLLHDLPAAAVGQGLVPRSEQRRRNHEGEPRQEEQASSPLPSETSERWVCEIKCLWLHDLLGKVSWLFGTITFQASAEGRFWTNVLVSFICSACVDALLFKAKWVALCVPACHLVLLLEAVARSLSAAPLQPVTLH